MLELRDYQDALVGNVRQSFASGNRSPLMVLSTGGGKTVIFCYITQRAQARGKRVYILVHRNELHEQVSDTLGNFEVDHGIIAAGRTMNRRALTQVASVFTIARRLERVPVPDLVIADEAHHAIGGSTWGKCIAHWREQNERLQILGVTATPERLSGEGLGETFDDMVLGPTTGELIESGALCRYRLFAPSMIDTAGMHLRAGDFVRGEAQAAASKPAIVGNAIEHYAKYLNGAPAVCFCVSVEHAEMMADRFRAAGFRSVSIDGTMERGLRRHVIADLRRGALNVITSCDVISEGLDVPGLHGAILLRPTWSLALHLQQIGRVLRPADGKQAAIVLDHVGNTRRLGLPDDPRNWTLAGNATGRREAGENVAIRQCEACFAVSPAAAQKCRECGYVFPLKPRTVDETEGELSEVEIARMKREAKTAQAQAGDYETLVALGRMRGYKSPEGWAKHLLAARAQKQARKLGAL